MGFFRCCKPLKDLDISVGSIWAESGRIEQDRAGLLTLAMGEQDQDRDRDQDQDQARNQGQKWQFEGPTCPYLRLRAIVGDFAVYPMY